MRGEVMVILADDLTGAADSAVALAGPGGQALVDLCGDAAFLSVYTAAPIVSLDLHTRGLPAALATRRVMEAGRAAQASGRRLFKKIDSTWRGHIGAELAALAEALDPGTLFIVAAAHPDLGRTVVDGQLRVHGTAVDRPPLRLELEAHGFVCRQVGGSASVAEGVAAWRLADTANPAPTALVCDAVSRPDLQHIVDATWPLGRQVVLVGSGGLAQAIAAVVDAASSNSDAADIGLGTVPAVSVSDLPAPGRRLFVVGSHASIARAQVDALASVGGVTVIDMTLEELQGGQDAPASSATAARFARAWSTGDDLVLRPSPDLPIDAAMAPAIAEALARLAASAISSATALIVCGGDTARALFDLLGVQQLRVRPSSEVGTTLAASASLPGLPIALKAGAFGDAGLLIRLGQIGRAHV